MLPTSPATAPGRGTSEPAPEPAEAPPARGAAPRGTPRRWVIAWAAAAVVLAAAAAVLIFLGDNEGVASRVVGFGSVIVTAMALGAAIRWTEGSRRLCWILTAAGLACVALASALDAATGTTTAPAGGNVMIDVVWLATFPVWIAGIVVRDRPALRNAGAGRILVDLLVVAIAAAIALEFVVMASPVVDQSATALNILHCGITVAGAVAAWLLLQPLILGRDRPRLTRWLLVGFFVALAVVNTAWMLVPGFPANPAVALLALLLGAAAMTSVLQPPEPLQPQPPPRGLATAADLIPFLLAAGMGAALVADELAAQPSPLILFGTLATVGLLLIRQTLLIRASRRALEGAEARALTDPLTGLGNARAFGDRLRTEVARSERHRMPLGLLLIDVDHLKLVNDTAGHPAGDRLLHGVATQMQELSRGGDVCCRVGGDEFALLAPGSDAAASIGLAERILAAVESLDSAGILPEPPSVSIGVAVLPDDGANRTELLDYADASLYAAKRAGRGRVARHDPDATDDLERELERARAALLARESDFRAVFEASLDAMLITDDDGVVLDVNRALVQLDGRPREELLGRPLEDLADTRAEPVVTSERAEISAGHGSATGELNVTLVATGREVTLEYGATQFAPGRQLIVLRDVTERRADEAELARREAENRAVVGALPDLMIRFAPGAVVRAVIVPSPDFPLLMDPAELIGRRVADLDIPPEAARSMIDQVAETLGSGQLTTSETAVDWGGRRRHFETRMVPYGDDQALALVRDVTDRREAERAREEADERYRLVVETANEGLVLTDGEDRVVFANHRFAEMLERDAADIPGTHVLDFMHPDERPEHERRLARVRATIAPDRFDLRLITRSGEPIWVQVSATPFADESGAYAGGLTMLTDITERKAAEEQLRESERRFRGLADAAPMIVWTSEAPDGGLVFVNRRAAEFTGRPVDEYRGYGFLTAIHPEDRADLITATQEAWRDGAPFEIEHRMRRHDGEYRWMLTSASPRFASDGALVGYVGSALDITERKAAVEHLRTSERQFRELADTAPMLVWVSDGPGGGVSFLNRSWLDFTGRTPEQEFGFGWIAGVHPDDKGAMLRTATAAWDRGEPFEVEYRLRRHDGEYRWILSSGRPRRAPGGELTGYVGSCADITERRRSEARLARLAYADELTGLPNRRLLEERLAECTAGSGCRAAALLYCGLDRFKLINDGLGGEAADGVLREFADRIAAAAPEAALVVRHSGDEFVVFLDDLEPAAAEGEALRAADALHAALAAPLTAGGEELLLSMTVGASVCPGDARDAAQLLAHADGAMSEAKRSAPGGTRLARPPARGTGTTLSEAARLRRAIERNELVLHYQPIVNLVTAWTELEETGGMRLGPHVRGVEALVRWQEPDGRLRMPDDFIPLAERTGLIGALGDWVVHEAVDQQAEWRRLDVGTMVGFNLSPIQLHDPGLVARVLTAAGRLGPGPSGLTMEMTESVAMADLELSRQVMADLRRAGIEIAIDDFGTGYSTLGRLRDLEVDYLKVDGSFLSGVPESPVASGLLRGIVQLAVGAGMRPIAEGIETRSQWRFLVEHGCRRGQGFFFCGPVPADEMSGILAGQPVQIDFGVAEE